MQFFTGIRLSKIAICGLLGFPLGAWQTQNPAYSISVMDGQSAWNNVQAPLAHEAVIQVRDRNRKAVPGAYVEFDTPSSGASVLFANGATHFSSTTNSEGIATTAAVRNNGVAGAFVIAVHVSYEGQSVGETAIRQTNGARKVANLSGNPQDAAISSAVGASLSSNVLGITLGDQFLVNGAQTPGNSNLFAGTHLQTQSTSVTIFLHDKCEFLIAPNSSVVLGENMVHVESGSVRAKHFGTCKMGYAALWVQGVQPDSDGALSVTNGTMEVAAVSGQVQVINTVGETISNIAAGSTATFGASSAASGASAGAPQQRSKRGTYILIGTGVGASLAALGVAVDSAEHHTSTSP
jgi:hypothetical protein